MLLVPRRRPVPAGIAPLLSSAGFVDSYTALALFGLFVAQVTGSYLAPPSRAFRPLLVVAATYR